MYLLCNYIDPLSNVSMSSRDTAGMNTYVGD